MNGPSLLEHFSALEDPRQRWKVIYPLPEVLLLVLCATLGGAEDFVEVVRWGRSKLDFLRRFLPYERGVPGHDTLCDVVSALDPELFKAAFSAWVEDLREAEPDIVAIDGKTSRRSHDRGRRRSPLHLVSAWASRQRLVLGQQATSESPMRSWPSRCSWSGWPSPGRSSPSTPWGPCPGPPRPCWTGAPTICSR